MFIPEIGSEQTDNFYYSLSVFHEDPITRFNLIKLPFRVKASVWEGRTC